LDRYLEWRKETGDPLQQEEIEYVALRSSERLSASLMARATAGRRGVGSSKGPARGGVAPAGEMLLFEAAYWANRRAKEGRRSEAAVYNRRYEQLTENAAGG
jgi:hypothetical protein